MVVLTEIANKLQKILNGVDSETSGFGHLSNYLFAVATEGFHLDSVADTKAKKNFIPVFVGSLGGTYEPLPGLESADYTIPVTIYYPVRFKEDFYLLNEYLIKYFVGTQLNYGVHSGKCLSNISVAQYGELETLDLDSFNNWISSTYQKEINVNEMYMSMTFNLYLASVKSGYVFGNSATCNVVVSTNKGYSALIDNVSYNLYESSTAEGKLYLGHIYLPYRTEEGTLYYLYNNVVYDFSGETPVFKGNVINEIGATALYNSQNGEIVFDTGSIQFNSDPNAQQILGTNESEGLPTITANSSSFRMFINTAVVGQKELLGYIIKGKQQTLNISLKLEIAEGLTFERQCYIQSVNLPINKGELVSLTLTFSKKVS